MSLARVRLLHGLEGVALGILLPFLVPLLADRGLGPASIGLVLGASALAALLCYPVWGLVADGPLGRPRSIALAGLIAAFGGTWLLVSGSDPIVLGIVVSITFVGTSPLQPITDALSLESLGDESNPYGRLRAWASFGWAASAPASGVIWAWLGPSVVVGGFVASSLVISVVGAWLARRPVPVSGGRAPRAAIGSAMTVPPSDAGALARQIEALPGEAETLAPPPGLLTGLRHARPALASPVLLGFLAGLLITSLGTHASWSFIGLRILEQGGGTILVGIAAALPAIVEIPVFAGSRSLADRFGLRLLYVSGAGITAFLTLLIALAPEAAMITALHSVDGVSYALRYTAVVLIIGALLPARLRAVGQSLAWLVAAGLAPIVGNSVGGLVYGALGGGALFLACAALIAIGGVVVGFMLRGRSFEPTPATPRRA